MAHIALFAILDQRKYDDKINRIKTAIRLNLMIHNDPSKQQQN